MHGITRTLTLFASSLSCFVLTERDPLFEGMGKLFANRVRGRIGWGSGQTLEGGLLFAIRRLGFFDLGFQFIEHLEEVTEQLVRQKIVCDFVFATSGVQNGGHELGLGGQQQLEDGRLFFGHQNVSVRRDLVDSGGFIVLVLSYEEREGCLLLCGRGLLERILGTVNYVMRDRFLDFGVVEEEDIFM